MVFYSLLNLVFYESPIVGVAIMSGLELFGFVFIIIITLFFPRTVVAVIGWNIIKYEGVTVVLVLIILTVLALIIDMINLSNK